MAGAETQVRRFVRRYATVRSQALDHVHATAQSHYNQAHVQTAAKAKSYLAKVNKEEAVTSDPTKESPALAVARQERRLRQTAAATARARTLLDASKLHASKQNYMGMLKREEQDKLVASLTSAPDKPTSAVFLPPKKCPAGSEFQRRLYRLIDGGELDERAQRVVDKCEQDVHDRVRESIPPPPPPPPPPLHGLCAGDPHVVRGVRRRARPREGGREGRRGRVEEPREAVEGRVADLGRAAHRHAQDPEPEEELED